MCASEDEQAQAQECAAQAANMFVAPRSVIPGHFTCSATGQWQGDPLLVIPIIATGTPMIIFARTRSSNPPACAFDEWLTCGCSCLLSWIAACPVQLVGEHYSATCPQDSQTCLPRCDAGFPSVRGDGVFTCQNGVWVGDLVCEPISCGDTLDSAPPETSAFTVCTGGTTIGDTCEASCRDGFYSTVGTGTAQFT